MNAKEAGPNPASFILSDGLSSRHCEEPLRRSNPDCFCGKTLDCFAALAMTEIVGRARHTLAVIARLDRAIQYAEAALIESRSRGVLYAPLSRSMTAVAWKRCVQMLAPGTHHASRNDTHAQEFLHHAR
ncbi:hypothetical protein E4K66_00910 [Bradyrhizobium frederickii]|uniref:Uncharacterized protein n=1 Tax=Bradyrhizobium frederickii TaxID=2560054 RepID=A0A4Y9LGS4_9BRAD|nr:hypothetical protein E4K66_00910 [Bradyrhizobium frederickii]